MKGSRSSPHPWTLTVTAHVNKRIFLAGSSSSFINRTHVVESVQMYIPCTPVHGGHGKTVPQTILNGNNQTMIAIFFILTPWFLQCRENCTRFVPGSLSCDQNVTLFGKLYSNMRARQYSSNMRARQYRSFREWRHFFKLDDRNVRVTKISN